MKILFIYQFCSLGGVETCLRNRLKNIEDEHKIDILFFENYGGVELFDDINCNINFIGEKEKIIKFINTNEYDVMVSIDTPQILDILKEIKYKGKVILECHTTYEASLNYLKGLDIDNIRCIVVPSEFQKSIVQKSLRKEIDIVVVPNTIDREKFDVIEAEKEQTPILGWVGRLDDHKNWKMFIKIVKVCIANGLDIHGYIIGGKSSGSTVINELQELIIKYELGAYIKWFPYIENSDMARIYTKIGKSKGCIINTSKCESFGMTIIEAMACRCLTIANNFEVAYEIIKPGQNGLIVEMNDDNIDEIVEKINLVISNSVERNKMVGQGYDEVIKKYDAKNAWTRYTYALKEYL